MNSHVRVSQVSCGCHITPSLGAFSLAGLATRLRARAIFAVWSCFCSFLLRKYYSNGLVGVGVGVEVKDLIWTTDEVTTILGDVCSDSVDISTLIGSTQVFHNVSETSGPTGFLFFGFPRGVASTKVSEQVGVYILVHLCQLHESEGKEEE